MLLTFKSGSQRRADVKEQAFHQSFEVHNSLFADITHFYFSWGEILTGTEHTCKMKANYPTSCMGDDFWKMTTFGV